MSEGEKIGIRRAGIQLAFVSISQVFVLAVWFSATAVVPALSREWNLSGDEAVWLTASVQLGFVTGAIASALLNLADRIPPHVLLGLCAAAAAACTGLLAWFADGMLTALPLRVMTGVFLAGVYPVGMKLVASWFPAQGRGRSMGVMLGALTLGSALPHLVGGLGSLEWQSVLGTAAIMASLGALIALMWIRPGPEAGTSAVRLSPRAAISAVRRRPAKLINLGYFGHMWELYGLWTWLPSFLLASELTRGASPGQYVSLASFAAIGVAGVAGCLLGGWLADRVGRPRTAAWSLVISGMCCLVSPLVFGGPWIVLVVLAVLWGAAVIADSGVFSAALSETVAREHIGTALTMLTAIGYLLTIVSIQLVSIVSRLVGWQFAFVVLAIGPLVGTIAMLALGNRGRPSAPDLAPSGR